MKGRISKNGFTLIELMVVIGLIGIATIIALPNLKELKKTNSLYSEAKKVVMDIRYMRQLAMDRQEIMRIKFSSDRKSYILGYGPNGFDNIEKTVYLESGTEFDEVLGGTIFEIDAEGVPVGGVKTISLKISDKTILVIARPGGKVETKWPY